MRTGGFFIALTPLVLAAVLTAAGCSRDEPPSEAERADLQLNQGLALARGGKTDEAIERFGEVLKLDPDNIGAYYNLAVAYSRKGDHEKEAAFYRKVIETAPRADPGNRSVILSATYYNLAILALMDRDRPAAFDYLGRALETTTDKDAYFHDLRSDPDLAPIRDDPRFKALMQKYWPDFGEIKGALPRSGVKPPRPPGP